MGKLSFRDQQRAFFQVAPPASRAARRPFGFVQGGLCGIKEVNLPLATQHLAAPPRKGRVAARHVLGYFQYRSLKA